MKTENEAATTIQATSKYWKGFKAAGVFLIIIGAALASKPDPAGTWVFLLGFGAFLYGMIGSWWNHS